MRLVLRCWSCIYCDSVSKCISFIFYFMFIITYSFFFAHNYIIFQWLNSLLMYTSSFLISIYAANKLPSKWLIWSLWFIFFSCHNVSNFFLIWATLLNSKDLSFIIGKTKNKLFASVEYLIITFNKIPFLCIQKYCRIANYSTNLVMQK